MRMWVLMVVLATVSFGASAAETPAAEPQVAETTLKDQTDVCVTAYNNGLALVRDTRALALPQGEMHLRFMDVAAQIRPETVSLRSVAAPGSVAIIEQNYEYDLMSPAKLMEKYVGKQVKLVNFSNEIGFTEVTADLLSTNEGTVFKVGDQIYLGHPGTVVLPQIPENLIAKPSLIWLVNNAQSEQRLEATYLTNGVTWKADYVITLARDDQSLGVSGWVTMNNQSGTTYTNAQLKLVAGDVNVVREEMVSAEGGRVFFDMAQKAAPMPREEAFAEYHLYTIQRRTTIKQNESKQLALLSGEGIRCAKKYEYRGQEYFYSQPCPPQKEEHVAVVLEFRNEEANQLGMPLPAGVMRIYQEDSDGMLQFAGEDQIKHTPKDEDVRLRMGNAFDVIGERTQTDYRQIAPNVHESAYVIVVRNHKESDIAVDIVEPMPGDWIVLEKSQEFVKKDAHTAVFTVPVAKDGEAKVTYRVRVTF